MNVIGNAALASWNLDPRLIALLVVLAVVYVRGWMRGRRLIRGAYDQERLGAFVAGLFAIFIANNSPLDSFDSLSLSAHMVQHLLLMMIAPPLILLAEPLLPLLRGLPKAFVKEGLGPFLALAPLRRFFTRLTSPVAAWFAFAISTVAWHMPLMYELALGSPTWHGLQHACFFWTGILFWWPIVRPGPGRYRWPLWIGIPYLLTADLVNTGISAFFIFSGKVLYQTYEAIQIGGMTARQDQTLAGAIMWVPGSIVYLLPAVGIAMKLLSNSQPRASVVVRRASGVDQRRSWLVRWKAPALRRAAQIAMTAIAVAVIADGFLGPQVAPMNLAGVLPWIHWRAFSIIALLLIGNLFCMTCPFTFVRDVGRVVLPATLRWPRVLRTKWLPVALIVIYLWAYEAFALWDKPFVTAWIIAGYFGAAVIVDGLFRGASFCKYVCPIGQYHFIGSILSPREVGVRKESVCQSCRTYDCIRGNDHQRGCELYLFQPKKSGNLDCTFCLDCVKACPHDNVGLVQVAPASTLLRDPYRSSIGRLSGRADWAALVLVIVFGAFVNAAGMVSPVLNVEHRWHARLGVDAMPAIVGIFVIAGVLLAPLISVRVCAWLSGMRDTRAVRRFIFALVPVGASMWAAHLLYHVLTSGAAALPAIQRTVSRSTDAVASAYMPGWLTPLQLVVLDAGLLLTLYLCWQIGKQVVEKARSAVTVTLPWMMLSCALYAAGVWILFQPMQMRGMMH